MTISKKIDEIEERKNVFSDKKRLENGKTYIPRFLIRESNIDEIIGVLKGIKPAMQDNCFDRDLEKLKKSLDELEDIYGVNYLISSHKYLINSPNDFCEVVDIDDERDGLVSFSLSFESSLNKKSEEFFLKKSKTWERNKEFSRKFGEVMGYPECCLDFGYSLSGNVGDAESKKESRTWSKAHIRSFRNSDTVSEALNIYTIKPLVSHVPCSLDCKGSIKYAKQMFKLLKEEDNLYADLRRYFLRLNSLYWFYSEFFLFDGDKNRNELFYNDFHKVSFSENVFYGGMEKEFLEKLERTEELLNKGNRLVMKRDCFKIFEGDKELGKVEKDHPFENILF